MASTSRLDDIIWSAEYTAETQKEQIKLLFLEVIGEDEEVTRIDRKTDNDVSKEARNQLRAELRQLVEAL